MRIYDDTYIQSSEGVVLEEGQKLSQLKQVACPSCGTGNRLPAGRDPAAAKCGRCGSLLISDHPIDVDDDGLARVLEGTKGTVVLDVWAPWCGPCRIMAPNFAAAAKELAGKAIFLKMNADVCQSPAKLGVRGIPALFLFEDGKVHARQAGLMSAEGIVKWIESN